MSSGVGSGASGLGGMTVMGQASVGSNVTVAGSSLVACIYCSRMQCKGCPLKFDDKITLRKVLTKAGVTT